MKEETSQCFLSALFESEQRDDGRMRAAAVVVGGASNRRFRGCRQVKSRVLPRRCKTMQDDAREVELVGAQTDPNNLLLE